jgi:hypothetical protein
MGEGFRKLFVSGVVVLAAPLAVTGLAAAGVSPGDALEAIGVHSDEVDPDHALSPEHGVPAEPADADGPSASQTAGSRPGPPPTSPRADPSDRGGATGAETQEESSDAAPAGPAAPSPAAEAEDPAAPSETDPAPGPLDGIDDIVDDPVGGADDIIDKGVETVGGLLP